MAQHAYACGSRTHACSHGKAHSITDATGPGQHRTLRHHQRMPVSIRTCASYLGRAHLPRGRASPDDRATGSRSRRMSMIHERSEREARASLPYICLMPMSVYIHRRLLTYGVAWLSRLSGGGWISVSVSVSVLPLLSLLNCRTHGRSLHSCMSMTMNERHEKRG